MIGCDELEGMMNTKPILFSAPMIRALLDGRKTQTRRIVKPQTVCEPFDFKDGDFLMNTKDGSPVACPYGYRGDLLWVRETCRAKELSDDEAEHRAGEDGDECPQYGLDGVLYTADSWFRPIENTRQASDAWSALNAYRGKRGAKVTAIHMPRWASRLTLRITDVRVERLQDISAKNILAEGAVLRPHTDQFGRNPVSAFDGAVYLDLKSLWARGWESINGKGSWNANPWVWVIGFEVIKANVDKVLV